MRTGHALAVLTTSVVLSCASTSALPPASPGQTGGSPAAAHVRWVDMTRGQRLDFMIHTVMPKMKAEFVAFDSKRFARMDCATCHGEGLEDGTYALPNDKLPKLLEPDLFAKHREKTPEITKFMLEKVEPEMAALMEVPEFDPATHKGLSCYLCHPRELEPDKPAPPPAEHF